MKYLLYLEEGSIKITKEKNIPHLTTKVCEVEIELEEDTEYTLKICNYAILAYNADLLAQLNRIENKKDMN